MTQDNNPPGMSPIYAAARDMLDALDRGATAITVQEGTIFARLVDSGNYRALLVDDAQPIHPDTLATWAAAFGVDAPAWATESGGKVARLEWPTDGEARGEGSRVMWIGQER